MTTVSVTIRPAERTPIPANTLARFRGLNAPDPSPTYVVPMDPARIGRAFTVAEMADALARATAAEPYRAPDRLRAPDPLKGELARLILSGSAKQDHMMDLTQSRPTLGAIRESQKRKAQVKARAIRMRAELPLEDRVHVALPPTPASASKPIGECRWCALRKPIWSDQLCYMCLHDPSRVIARTNAEASSGERATAPDWLQVQAAALARRAVAHAEAAQIAADRVAEVVARVQAAVAQQPHVAAPVAAPMPVATKKFRMVPQVGPDGRTRYVRVEA